MLKEFMLKSSDIEGLGLFAGQPYEVGDLLISWGGFKRITPEQYADMTPGQQDKVCFFKGEIIVMHAPACYVNHSCDPNTEATSEGDVAIRTIESGEEITTDYSLVLPEGESMKCRCTSSNCRGTIFGKNKPKP